VLRPFLILPARRFLRRRIPVAMITGTKGKTTTTRMLAHILTEAGHVVGYTSTDGIIIGGELVTERDSSGYVGAARVMKNPSITVAVLETARGDLLRNGLYLDRCDVAALLNVGREQIGMDGIDSVEQMARLKRRVIDTARTVVLNADDPSCRGLLNEFPSRRTILFSSEAPGQTVREHLARGGVAFCQDETAEREGSEIVRLEGSQRRTVLAVTELRSSWGGVVRHNIANAMAAAALAEGLGVPPPFVSSGLASFENSLVHSSGRFNVFEGMPFLLIIDEAMSPPAAEALVESVRRIDSAGQRLCILTATGNRPPWHFSEFAMILAGAFDQFVCYELDRYRRGRAPGAIAEALRSGLLEAGVAPERIEVAVDLDTAVQIALRRLEPGDLLVVLGAFKRSELRELVASFHSALPAIEPGGP